MQNNNLLEKINKVKEFHRAFNISHHEHPTIPDIKLCELRHRLMQEENDEYLEACKRSDLTEIADALGDKMYILFGTLITHGLQYKIAEIFDEIQRSNMSKLDENGKPIYRKDGKVMKSSRYFKPEIEKILKQ